MMKRFKDQVRTVQPLQSGEVPLASNTYVSLVEGLGLFMVYVAILFMRLPVVTCDGLF